MYEFAYAQNTRGRIVLPFSAATSDTLKILNIFHKNISNTINQTTPFSMNSKLKKNHEEDYCSQMIDYVKQEIVIVDSL